MGLVSHRMVTFIYMIYISRYCSFSVDWSICWPKYCKNQHSLALNCATLVIKANLNMMGYFDFFLAFTDKSYCFKINIDEFWWKCQHI